MTTAEASEFLDAGGDPDVLLIANTPELGITYATADALPLRVVNVLAGQARVHQRIRRRMDLLKAHAQAVEGARNGHR